MKTFQKFLEARGKARRPPDHVVEVKDNQHIYELLKQYSITEGGVFSNICHFWKYDSPSKVPEDEIDWMRTNDYEHGAIGWKGQIVPFSTAARIRFQNRGFNSDR